MLLLKLLEKHDNRKQTSDTDPENTMDTPDAADVLLRMAGQA